MLKIISVILLSITLISCGDKKDVTVSKPGGQINGAGATFRIRFTQNGSMNMQRSTKMQRSTISQ
ncbi:MAG: hypothetical protein IPL53_08060 [Ignavibacteria bacterium]|nr:hypothetical protein [Ignavibacteria bacterium]